MRASGLPIDEALPALRAALARGPNAVLVAPPGAGKSTVVPLALLQEPWLQNRKVLMLEPRRLAARAVAQRMAATLGESVGARVGYRMRLDTKVSRATRIEVVTEGVLTRMLQTDASLGDVGAVIFDEFHERSLQADLGLALCLDAQAVLRPELRLLAMSATLDVERVAVLLGEAPIVRTEGRSYPIDIRYVARGAPPLPDRESTVERAVAGAVSNALAEQSGDALVFLPGAAEIRRVATLLEVRLDRSVRVVPLYGDLGFAAQDAALEPSPGGTRRVVLATNIAETSLTIPGIRIVVDSGLVRRARFDPATGMSRLETLRISRASADQRAGRAGRVAPGVCYRCWSSDYDRSLAPHTAPEILESDLMPLALELAGWGVQDAGALRWLDPPPSAMLGAARDVLTRLDALDENGRITPHGRALLAWPMHPRLAQIMVYGIASKTAGLAADLAALLGERDPLRGAGNADLDIASRLQQLQRSAQDERLALIRRNAAHYRQLADRGRSTESAAVPEPIAKAGIVDAGVLCALAWPDRIGRRRAGGSGRYLLTNGRGAVLARTDAVGNSEFLIALDVDDSDREARVLLAAGVNQAAIEAVCQRHLVTSDEIRWDPATESVLAHRQQRLDALVLDDKPLLEPDPDAVLAAMLVGIRSMGLESLPWTDAAHQWLARVRFVGALRVPDLDDWPRFSDADLAATIDAWLAPWLTDCSRRAHLGRLDLFAILRARLTPNQLRKLDELAPAELALPTGSRVAIDYLDPNAPCASMRMQEVFGLAATPAIGGGRAPVTFKLLSPARRPLQITRDLASFWRNAYSEVRKDMRGQYPKHYWPENPLQAEPVRGVRRRSNK